MMTIAMQDMVRAMVPQLRAWAGDPDVACVLIKGTGAKAFCAGGPYSSPTLVTL